MNHTLKMSLSVLTLSFLITILSCESIGINAEALSEDQQVLKLVNDIRTKGCNCGNKYYPPVKPLVWNETLENVALAHSKDMAQKRYFAHIDKNGNSAEGRLEIAGYNWRSYGENIFQSTDPSHTTAVAVQAWKDSPGHCANMMKDHFTEMGIGQHGGFWTQLFGSR